MAIVDPPCPFPHSVTLSHLDKHPFLDKQGDWTRRISRASIASSSKVKKSSEILLCVISTQKIKLDRLRALLRLSDSSHDRFGGRKVAIKKTSHSGWYFSRRRSKG